MRTIHGLLTCLLVTAGCGKVSGLVDSKGGGDDVIDAAVTIDADPHGAVKVTALETQQSGQPSVGIEVLFMEPDGSLAARLRTDSNGKAQANVLAGSSVTVIWPTGPTSTILETITQVKPGDDLRMYDGFAQYGQTVDPPPTHMLNVNYPAFSGATQYYTYGSCGSGYSTTTSSQLTFYAACETSTMDVVVLAYNASGPAGFLVRSGVTPGQGSVSLSGAYQSLSSFNANLTNIPGTVSNLSVYRYTGDGYGPEAYAYASPPTSTEMLPMQVVQTSSPGFFNTLLQSPQRSVSTISQPVGASTLTLNLDVGATMLPFIVTPILDPATGKVTTTDTTTDGDAYAVDVVYFRTVGQVSSQFEWAVLMPQVGGFTLPTLPADLMNLYPAAGDSSNAFNNTARLVDIDNKTYDDLRQDVIGVVSTATTGRSDATMIRTSQSPNNND